MKIFVINLKKDEKKREKIKQELEKYNLDYELIEAIDGNKLSEKELELLVKDYKKAYLAKGEIGCALSHQLAYKKMQENKLHHALILEDDVEFDEKISSLLSDMDEFLADKKRFLCLAYKSKRVFKPLSYETKKGFKIRESYEASRLHAYFITLQAAESIMKINQPIILEADMLFPFYQLTFLKTYSLDEDIINTNDMAAEHSNLDKDRKAFFHPRRKYRKQMLRKHPLFWFTFIYGKIIKRGIFGIKRNKGKNI